MQRSGVFLSQNKITFKFLANLASTLNATVSLTSISLKEKSTHLIFCEFIHTDLDNFKVKLCHQVFAKRSNVNIHVYLVCARSLG